MRTFQLEALVVAVVLATVVLLTGGKPVEWLGAAAVFFTFCYTQVGARLAEAEAERTRLEHALHATAEPRLIYTGPAVACHRWLTRYLLLKELCWLAYFVWLGAWSALVGVFVFLLYPLWRQWWKS